MTEWVPENPLAREREIHRAGVAASDTPITAVTGPSRPIPEVNANAARMYAMPALFFLVGLTLAGLALLAPFPPWVQPQPSIPSLSLYVAAGLSFLWVGLFLSILRPRNGIGRLMFAAGFTWFSFNIIRVDSEFTFTLGSFIYTLYLAVVEHMFLVFPSGRAQSARDRFLITIGYAWWFLSSLIGHLFWSSRDQCFRGGCPRNLLLAYRSHFLDTVTGRIDGLLGLVFAGIVLTIVARRWIGSTTAARRMLAPVVWGGIPIAAVVLAVQAAQTLDPWPFDLWSPVGQWVLLALPVAFLLGLLRMRLDHTAVSTLMVELGSMNPPVSMARLRQALRKALRDPAVELTVWSPSRGAFIDVDGQVIDISGSDRAQAVHILKNAGTVRGALIHDPILCEDPKLVQAVAASAQFCIENERLHADVQARLGEIQALSVRLVRSVDAERRRVERDLHDGTQQYLSTLSIILAESRVRAAHIPELSESLTTAANLVDRTLGDLRNLARGLHPTVLTDAGLGPALESLAEHSVTRVTLESAVPERPPGLAEATAYFVAAEALTNATKHARASSVAIRAAQMDTHLVVEIVDDGIGGAEPAGGSGLQGLADRVAAVNGQFSVHSPAGEGTRVMARIPCA